MPTAGSASTPACRSIAAARPAMTAIRVILVDDQELVRTGFRMILEDQPDIEVVGEAADGKRASTPPSGSAPMSS